MNTDVILSVLLADDNTDHRDGIIRLIDGVNDIECIGHTNKLQEVVDMSKDLVPDIVVLSFLDASLEDDIIKTIIETKLSCPTSGVLTINEHRSDEYVIQCIQSGVDGYLVNKMSRGEFLTALRMVSLGYSVIKLIANINRLYYISQDHTNLGQFPVKDKKGRILHDRELEILTLASKGKRNKEIASDLGITCNTVASHFVHIFRKLGVESRTEAVLYAMKVGSIEHN